MVFPLITRLRRRFFPRVELVPYNHDAPGGPTLAAGDVLVAILEREAFSIIAALSRLPAGIPSGTRRRWRVVEVLAHGSVVVRCGHDRTILDWLTWSEGNLTVCRPFPLTTELRIRWFKEVRS